MSRIDLVIYFLIYSFIGWTCEVIYCSIPRGLFVNRGFLNGHICPIYGFGAVFIISFLSSFKDNIVELFLLAMLLTSILEYITSVILEKLFNTKWWDYSNNKFNINGRVCLLNSTLFGLLSVILVHVVHPCIVNLIESIQVSYKVMFVYIVGIIFLIDMIFTLKGLISLQGKLKLLSSINIDFKNLNAKIKTSILESNGLRGKNKNFAIKENMNFIHKKLRNKSFQEKRFLKAFPGMKHKIYNEQLIYFRELLKEKRSKKKS